MKKLQQFYIMKISSNRLEKFDYHLKRLLGNTGAHIREIRNNGELIALGDNQALRSIRSIRYERNPDIIRYDPEALNLLYEQKKELKKLPFTDSVKKQISIINTNIDKLFIVTDKLDMYLIHINFIQNKSTLNLYSKYQCFKVS